MAGFPLPIRSDSTGVSLLIKVTPKSSCDEVIGLVKMSDHQQRLSIKIRAFPEKGKANKAIISLLAKHFAIPKSDFKITSGATSRLKTVRINSDRETISQKLDHLIIRSKTD